MVQRSVAVDEYIAGFPGEAREVLEAIRRTIHDVAPGCAEEIAYRMPLVTSGGRRLLYFAGWKRHTALYGVGRRESPLEEELEPYREPKGTLRFPLAEPFPHDLLRRLVAGLLEEHSSG